MIRDKIKEYMSHTSVTQSELSRRVGVSRSSISEFLSGKKDVKIITLEKIFTELDIKLPSPLK